MADLQALFELWATNSEFREKFKINRIEAFKSAGIDVSPEEIELIESMLKSEELDKRVNK